ncbi:type II toxin-antitoxin system HicB family antitoxin [Synechococcus sp. BA-132 BA5]|uniref:type II toxin-antitoxin system HicB family antitoxin n=1 Tax=Synechococcus sp. BA-132 BA5 TaxID=3110252 RepID=UPI002B1FAC36|nr:type II toxin-antitoxin system HicB family antitoxin [Synechococcus sp. BA-132 BA5]MEA5415091.1 type II toxin-antitoxin system HicB family antitoxin [Synechococcus sp. BA-132 BA5]
MNLMTVDGYHARIEYDQETNQFRGEILGLTGGADFYGSNPEQLRLEFKKSLDVFLEICKEQNIEPRRDYSGRFNLRISPDLHEKLAMTAEAQGKSLNALVQEALQRSVTA